METCLALAWAYPLGVDERPGTHQKLSPRREGPLPRTVRCELDSPCFLWALPAQFIWESLGFIQHPVLAAAVRGLGHELWVK